MESKHLCPIVSQVKQTHVPMQLHPVQHNAQALAERNVQWSLGTCVSVTLTRPRFWDPAPPDVASVGLRHQIVREDDGSWRCTVCQRTAASRLRVRLVTSTCRGVDLVAQGTTPSAVGRNLSLQNKLHKEWNDKPPGGHDLSWAGLGQGTITCQKCTKNGLMHLKPGENRFCCSVQAMRMQKTEDDKCYSNKFNNFRQRTTSFWMTPQTMFFAKNVKVINTPRNGNLLLAQRAKSHPLWCQSLVMASRLKATCVSNLCKNVDGQPRLRQIEVRCFGSVLSTGRSGPFPDPNERLHRRWKRGELEATSSD